MNIELRSFKQKSPGRLPKADSGGYGGHGAWLPANPTHVYGERRQARVHRLMAQALPDNSHYQHPACKYHEDKPSLDDE